MAEPQLIEYIKKAKEAGQTDEQTRALLYKNGWTESETMNAFSAVNQERVQDGPTQIQPMSQVKQPDQGEKTIEAQYEEKPARNSSSFVLKFLIILIVLAILGGGIYFALAQTKFLSTFFPIKTAPVVANNPVAATQKTPVTVFLATQKIATILQDYDITKLTVYSFNENGGSVAFCVPKKLDNKFDCFLNNQKLNNPYNFKPYWIGDSPDGKRIISLYLDPATKQSFIFENNQEGIRYDGTITFPKFSANSQSFYYVVIGKDNKSFVVLDNKPGSSHDKIYGVPAISNDGKYIVYGARDGQDLFWVADLINAEK
ncbi:MAG: hypothetical protein A2358_03070 [Candidatus Staskawiczbacteria bacterium RIFOXYB1_FULL_37_44]|uniref:Uncharacterized protein n=1 Tax=Candidatus Staskawiczbacteria bacterium RIFOXYB1_FULL_37_44 TaxID=1802223 RepID=A0A1G2IVR6_9BACT|nr:MAG: hypothetical protein A2358_03070 [Candidatus Staskawiczbacteria bacterium RIFOXYB1_FULL_37_44]OGZ83588.1 MAG: hypothetical protein A2416_04535 [Candidatus Staskawiczbacteria bacterium RIFOXYC1_FULL_37_52]OGZ88687.1 MAG: hypothetical protein A2581_02790 [Candidatus Staskawiczbacteria bacterium RIFOXYD1_FULL_37_110]OGZ89028.1 MAG: hypothetical protein A2444_00130 [Candidatus Staskawiczbacteria bacterium RIFOXYC2_FULL_37_19]